MSKLIVLAVQSTLKKTFLKKGDVNRHKDKQKPKESVACRSACKKY